MEIQAFFLGLGFGVPLGMFLLIGIALLGSKGTGKRAGYNGPAPPHLKDMPKKAPPPPPPRRLPDQHTYVHHK